MRFIKSSLDALGTGSGVAWPFFGLVSSALGLVAGSTASLLTGSISCVIFCTVFSATFWISYHQASDEMRQAKETAQNAINHLEQSLIEYLTDCYHLYASECKKKRCFTIQSSATAFILSKIKSDAKLFQDNNQINDVNVYSLIKILADVKDLEKFLESLFGNQFVFNDQDEYLKLIHTVTINYFQRHVTQQQSITLNQPIKAWFIGAAGAFGAITGFTAGFLGLLMGIGVLTSFTYVPLVIWSAISTGATLALLVGSHCAARTRKLYALNQSVNECELTIKYLNVIHEKCSSEITSNLTATRFKDAANEPIIHPTFSHRFFDIKQNQASAQVKEILNAPQDFPSNSSHGM